MDTNLQPSMNEFSFLDQKVDLTSSTILFTELSAIGTIPCPHHMSMTCNDCITPSVTFDSPKDATIYLQNKKSIQFTEVQVSSTLIPETETPMTITSSSPTRIQLESSHIPSTDHSCGLSSDSTNSPDVTFSTAYHPSLLFITQTTDSSLGITLPKNNNDQLGMKIGVGIASMTFIIIAVTLSLLYFKRKNRTTNIPENATSKKIEIIPNENFRYLHPAHTSEETYEEIDLDEPAKSILSSTEVDHDIRLTVTGEESGNLESDTYNHLQVISSKIRHKSTQQEIYIHSKESDSRDSIYNHLGQNLEGHNLNDTCNHIAINQNSNPVFARGDYQNTRSRDSGVHTPMHATYHHNPFDQAFSSPTTDNREHISSCITVDDFRNIELERIR